MTIKLNIGCGRRDFGEDWDHIDGSDYPHIKSHNIINLPYENNSVDLIYASHVFEYFDREEAIIVLENWKKVLKIGGILRLAVPDFEACAKLYVEKGYPLSNFLGPIFGKWSMTKDEVIYHKTIYDYNSLKKVLEDNGFSEAKKWDWKEVDHGKYDDYSQAYLPHMDKNNGTLISLNIECKKLI